MNLNIHLQSNDAENEIQHERCCCFFQLFTSFLLAKNYKLIAINSVFEVVMAHYTIAIDHNDVPFLKKS